MSYINVVDARTFDAKQVIRVAPEMEDRNISGLTFSPDSRAVYVCKLIRLLSLSPFFETTPCCCMFYWHDMCSSGQSIARV